MEEIAQPDRYQNIFLRLLMPVLSSDWVRLIFEAIRLIVRLAGREVYSGMYRILAYEVVLELKDIKGENAVVERRQKVKFLQENIIAYQTEVWGEGDILADFKCSPGVVVDQYQEGLKQVLLISLRETKSKGDVVDFSFQRKVKGGWTKKQEWFQVELKHKTDVMRASVVFPKGRPCKRAVLVQRNRNRSRLLGKDHFTTLADGRELVSWAERKPPVHELYTLKWTW